MGNRIVLTAATAANCVGMFVLIYSDDWGLPILLRLAILVVFVFLNVLLFKFRKELREEELQRTETDFSDRPVKLAKTQAIGATTAVVVALAGPLWMPLTTKTPGTVRIQVFVSLFLAIFISSIFAWRWKQRNLSFRHLGKNMVIGTVLVIPLVGFDAVGLVRSYAVTRITREIVNANTAREGREKSMDSVNQYVGDLVAIDPGFAPNDVKISLKNYIDGFEGQIVDFKLKDYSGIKTENKKTEDARAELAKLVSKYE